MTKLDNEVDITGCGIVLIFARKSGRARIKPTVLSIGTGMFVGARIGSWPFGHSAPIGLVVEATAAVLVCIEHLTGSLAADHFTDLVAVCQLEWAVCRKVRLTACNATVVIIVGGLLEVFSRRDGDWHIEAINGAHFVVAAVVQAAQ